MSSGLQVFIGQNVVEISIKMKTIVWKPLMIKIIKLRLRNSDNQLLQLVSTSQILFFLLINFRSGLLARIRWAVCILKSHRISCISLSRTDSGLCIYTICQHDKISISCTIPSRFPFLPIYLLTLAFFLCQFAVFTYVINHFIFVTT